MSPITILCTVFTSQQIIKIPTAGRWDYPENPMVGTHPNYNGLQRVTATIVIPHYQMYIFKWSSTSVPERSN